ncbi:hypothetical protein LTR86_002968 [Recurvomyces mirabilis]|nr:hypothetical protein LTR86_002968 [Recurvomyces mirabilis]
MAKSSRSSALKKNNKQLKKKVFGPAEAARQERLNAKLMALASQPKPPRADMEVETEELVKDAKAGNEMEVEEEGTTSKTKKPTRASGVFDYGPDAKKTPRASRSASRVQKTRHRRNRNDIVFAPTGIAKAKANARKRSKR